MSNALTLSDMSPALRKVVGRESPRATSAEEPDAGNPLVRIWRGAGMGNRPAYSTKHFCAASSGACPLLPPSQPSPARGEGAQCPAAATEEPVWVKVSPLGEGVSGEGEAWRIFSLAVLTPLAHTRPPQFLPTWQDQ